MQSLGEHLRALVIEDDDQLRRVVERMVKMMVTEVVIAPNGAAGLAALAAHDFDLVITDLKMPGVSGIDVAKWIHANRPSVVVLVTSGFATAADHEEIERAGATLLRKPYTPQAIYEAVRAAMDAG